MEVAIDVHSDFAFFEVEDEFSLCASIEQLPCVCDVVVNPSMELEDEHITAVHITFRLKVVGEEVVTFLEQMIEQAKQDHIELHMRALHEELCLTRPLTQQLQRAWTSQQEYYKNRNTQEEEY